MYRVDRIEDHMSNKEEVDGNLYSIYFERIWYILQSVTSLKAK